VEEGGKEVVPPVTLKHCSNFYYEGSKAYEGRYVRRYRRYLESFDVPLYEEMQI
jgi:hypothetical protein